MHGAASDWPAAAPEIREAGGALANTASLGVALPSALDGHAQLGMGASGLIKALVPRQDLVWAIRVFEARDAPALYGGRGAWQELDEVLFSGNLKEWGTG